MSELMTLKNIGKTIAAKLESVGITTAQELREVGSREAFARLKALYPSTCLVFLYSLEGAASDTEYNRLPPDVKQSLKEYYGSYK